MNRYIKDNFNDDFCLGGGCYPETHLECGDLFEDLDNLKIKQDSGASFTTPKINVTDVTTTSITVAPKFNERPANTGNIASNGIDNKSWNNKIENAWCPVFVFN